MYKITVLDAPPLSSLVDLGIEHSQLLLVIVIENFHFLPTMVSNVLCARCNGARLVLTISSFTRSRCPSISRCCFLHTSSRDKVVVMPSNSQALLAISSHNLSYYGVDIAFTRYRSNQPISNPTHSPQKRFRALLCVLHSKTNFHILELFFQF